jgi:hypothetical protein
MKFGILMAVTVKIKISWNVTCNLMDEYKRFGGTWCLQLQGRTVILTQPLIQCIPGAEWPEHDASHLKKMWSFINTPPRVFVVGYLTIGTTFPLPETDNSTYS